MAAGYLFEWELFAAGGVAACCLLLRSQDVADVVLSLVGIPSAWDIVVGRFRTGGETYDNMLIGLCSFAWTMAALAGTACTRHVSRAAQIEQSGSLGG